MNLLPDAINFILGNRMIQTLQQDINQVKACLKQGRRKDMLKLFKKFQLSYIQKVIEGLTQFERDEFCKLMEYDNSD